MEESILIKIEIPVNSRGASFELVRNSIDTELNLEQVIAEIQMLRNTFFL